MREMQVFLYPFAVMKIKTKVMAHQRVTCPCTEGWQTRTLPGLKGSGTDRYQAILDPIDLRRPPWKSNMTPGSWSSCILRL